jgi:hypothetical protein
MHATDPDTELSRRGIGEIRYRRPASQFRIQRFERPVLRKMYEVTRLVQCGTAWLAASIHVACRCVIVAPSSRPTIGGQVQAKHAANSCFYQKTPDLPSTSLMKPFNGFGRRVFAMANWS